MLATEVTDLQGVVVDDNVLVALVCVAKFKGLGDRERVGTLVDGETLWVLDGRESCSNERVETDEGSVWLAGGEEGVGSLFGLKTMVSFVFGVLADSDKMFTVYEKNFKTRLYF